MLGLVLGLACEVSNEDHCVHKAIEADAWCAAEVPGKPFCSPCVAEQHGCVAEQPTAATCPRYTPDSAASTGAASSTGE
jgi:hypothetical protein